jgi:hypothetical protein
MNFDRVARQFRLGIPGMFPRIGEMATKATEYKAKRGLIDLTARFCKKAIANRIKKAHGLSHAEQ